MQKLKKLLVTLSVTVLVLVLSAAFAYADGDRIGTATGDAVNVRQSPDLSAKVVSQVYKGDTVSVLQTSGEWHKISYNDITGWVFGEFLSVRYTEIGTGTISGSGVNVRTMPNTASDVITVVDKGDKFSVNSKSGEWYRIKLPEGSFGWVNMNYIVVRDSNASRGAAQDVAVKADAGSSGNTDQSLSQQVIEYAKKFLGVKYVYGGTTPKGFDCSGFVQYVFNNYSINLERVAASQATQGTKISKGDLKPGDLVFFDTNGGHNYIEHVGIYIGNGDFIHASSGRTTRQVTISDLNVGFYNDTYMTARRILK